MFVQRILIIHNVSFHQLHNQLYDQGFRSIQESNSWTFSDFHFLTFLIYEYKIEYKVE